jgi:hypothetical protein
MIELGISSTKTSSKIKFENSGDFGDAANLRGVVTSQ